MYQEMIKDDSTMIFDDIPWPDDKDKPYDPKDTAPDYNLNFTKLYQWRDKYYGEYNSGLDPDNYDTEREFLYAIKHQSAPFVPDLYDGTEEIYCGVVFAYQDRVYLYRTDDKTIKPGDWVIVPRGEDDEETTARVVSVETYRECDVPYPVHKTKKIIKKDG